jgi:hypothetical protein
VLAVAAWADATNNSFSQNRFIITGIFMANHLNFGSVQILTNTSLHSMEQERFQKCKELLKYQNYLYLETSGGENSILYINDVHFFNASVN